MQRRLIGRTYVEHAGIRIGRSAAPVGAAKLAGDRDLALRDAERREDAFVARLPHDADDALTLGFVEIRIHIRFSELQPGKRRGPGREGLRRRRLLTRNVALRNWPFLDRPDRLSRYTIEHIQQPEFRRLRDDVDRLAVVFHREQLRAGDQIVVPQIVMKDLVMPEALARPQIECEQRVAEQVVAFAIAAPEIEGRRAGREISDAARLVDGKLGPGVGAPSRLPRVWRPLS